MDASLISRWNGKISRSDTVYHLGDFAYWKGISARDYARQLNGEIHLIVGNHDGDTVGNHSEHFASISAMSELAIEGQALFLCHYPMREWPGAWKGVWHLFGHVHGRLDQQPWGFSLDVGVDSHHFTPINIDIIAEKMSQKENIFRPRSSADEKNDGEA